MASFGWPKKAPSDKKTLSFGYLCSMRETSRPDFSFFFSLIRPTLLLLLIYFDMQGFLLIRHAFAIRSIRGIYSIHYYSTSSQAQTSIFFFLSSSPSLTKGKSGFYSDNYSLATRESKTQWTGQCGDAGHFPCCKHATRNQVSSHP